jgi:O-antigen ligase
MTQDEEVGLESSAAGRLGRWKHGVDLFIKNPLGYGYETVAVLGFRGNRGYLSSKGDPHNRYVEFLVEMGIIGIALFLYLFYLAFKGGWKLYLMAEDNFLKGLGLGFSATVVACFIVNIFGDRWTYAMLGAFYWVVWALVVRGNIIANKKQSMVELNSTATV